MGNSFSLLCCPNCHANVMKKSTYLECKTCNRQYPISHGIVRFLRDTSADLKLSFAKWDQLYRDELKKNEFEHDLEQYKSFYFPETYEQINDAKKLKGAVYLEIGCGPFHFGQLVSKECSLIIGIDVSPTALVLAKKMLDKKKIKNYLLIQGDILSLPIKNNSIDVIYGGGVIEHFKNTNSCVQELYRVLKPKGISFNTVPMLNIGSLTYRQVWGNIPNVIFLKQFAEFIHITLLRSKHMRYGYEFSFLPNTMRSIHKRAGFTNVTIDKFTVKLVFEFIPLKFRKIVVDLAENNRLFWPMIKVIGVK